MTAQDGESVQCAYCANEIEGGPGGWHDLRGFEVCTGDSPTSFHEPAPQTGGQR